MPSKTLKQHGFMAMSQSPAGRAKLRAHGKQPAPMQVAMEFMHADKGKKFKSSMQRMHRSHYASHHPGQRQDVPM